MYLWLLLASMNRESLASFLPTGWTLQHWRFLWVATIKPGYPNIWVVTGNSLLFAVVVMVLEVSIALLAGYVLSRWQFRGRLLLLQSTLLLHAFPAITLIFGDCSRATGFVQLVHDEGRQGCVDGLRRALHATYPVPDAHGSALASARGRHSFASYDSVGCPVPQH